MTQTSHHHPDPRLDQQFYAGVPIKRLVAWVIDMFTVVAICIGLVVLSIGFLAFVFPLVGFLVNFAYRVFALQKWSATPGMHLTGIELRNAQGERFSQKDALLHTGAYVLLFMSGIGIFANMLVILLSERGQGIHDLILNTIAINRPLD